MADRISRIIVIACVALALQAEVGADSERNVLDDPGHFVAVVDHLIAPGYDKLGRDAKLHLQSIRQLCSQTGPDELDAARVAWRRVKADWKRVQMTAVGPAMSLRTHRTIDFWPHRQPLVDRILSDDNELTPEWMANQSVAARGLNVVEYYLFDEQARQVIGTNKRICDYLVAVAADVHAHLTKLHDYWSAGSRWRSALLRFDGERVSGVATFSSSREAWQELLNVVLSATYNIRRLALIKPAGLRLHTRPRPELAEGRASRSSVEFIRSGIEGLNEIVAFPDNGIAALLVDQGHAEVAEELQGLVAEAVTAADRLNEPFTVSIHEQRELIESLDATLRRIQVILQVEIPQIFDIVMYFRDLDGD